MSSTNRVLVTGGTGFVGYWMRQTQQNNVEMLALNSVEYTAEEWTDGDWTHIAHLAPVSPSIVLKYAKEHKARVLYCSSGAVYEGATEYAYNKRLWESECVRSGVDVVIARLFTFIGAHLKNKYAITRFIEAAKSGRPPEVWGDGKTIRSYLYGEDLGRWMWKILLDGDGIYDVGSSVPYALANVAAMVSDVCDAPRPICTLLDHEHSIYLPDTTRARALGCAETVGLQEAIERVLNEG